MIKSNFLKVALAQIAPVWLQKEQTIQKIENADCFQKKMKNIKSLKRNEKFE